MVTTSQPVAAQYAAQVVDITSQAISRCGHADPLPVAAIEHAARTGDGYRSADSQFEPASLAKVVGAAAFARGAVLTGDDAVIGGFACSETAYWVETAEGCFRFS